MLQEKDFGIGMGDYAGAHSGFPGIFLSPEDIQSEKKELGPLGRVNCGSREDGVGHLPYPAVGGRQGIHAIEKNIRVPSTGFTDRFPGSDGHPVVPSENRIDRTVIGFQQTGHGIFTTFLGPVAVFKTCETDSRIMGQGIHETLMAFIGRRADQSSDLKDGAPSPEALGHMVTQHIPDLVIVRADKGRVFRRIRLSVKEYYRDAGVVDLVDFL